MEMEAYAQENVIPGERIAREDECEDTDDTGSVESYPGIALIGDIVRTGPGIQTSDSYISSPGPSIPSPAHTSFGRTAPGILTFDTDISSPGTPGIPSPAHTRSHGKAK